VESAMTDPPATEVNYASYLALDRLLQLQRPLTPAAEVEEEHDELLFIIVHQASELWMKQLLHELDKVKRDFSANHLFRVISTFRRCCTIVQVLIDQLQILETMTPLSFNQFRDRLQTSSGFQSMQFRELEFVLGYKRAGILDHYPAGLTGRAAAERRLRERSIPDHFYDFLAQRGVTIPEAVLARPVEAPHVADETVQDAVFDLYRRGGEYRILFELMTDFDEKLQEWRYHHVKIVERSIGNKAGTGGSLGVEFLKRTLFHQVFPDLWAIRHRF
jgi:tryptophan 2,3-dioxygenase